LPQAIDSACRCAEGAVQATQIKVGAIIATSLMFSRKRMGFQEATNDAAQAPGAQIVQYGTEASSRGCLKPQG
jgi:hypothetical protein